MLRRSLVRLGAPRLVSTPSLVQSPATMFTTKSSTVSRLCMAPLLSSQLSTVVSASSLARTGFRVPNTKVTQPTLHVSARGMSGFSYPAPRSLDAVVNMELLSKEPAEQISQIWVDYHAASVSSMAKVVPASMYKSMESRAVATPYFVLPIMREGGHFACLAQYQGNSWLVTYLEDFRRDPTSAQPYLCITVYKELAETKGIVLLRADICALATLNKTDAAKMLEQVARFYGDDTHYQHVFKFNKSPQTFDIEAAYAAANAMNP